MEKVLSSKSVSISDESKLYSFNTSCMTFLTLLIYSKSESKILLNFQTPLPLYCINNKYCVYPAEKSH
jgi:hypothetical protein